MSECVVRMEMPTKDRMCQMADDIDGVWYCHVMKKLCRQPDNGEIPSWCPIICSLPEGHGRLVDADAFSGHMKEYQEKIMEWRERSKTEGPEESYHRADSSLLTVVATKLILDNAPTIVPAERSET
jgi:hypothetical protein